MLWFLPSLALAFPSVVEELPGGQVDWTRLELVASAEGAPPGGSILSWEAMEGEARSKLGPRILELSRLVRIGAGRLASSLLDGSDRIADRLDENLSLWEVFKVNYFTSGKVEISGSLPLQTWLRPAMVAMAHGKERTGPATGPITGLVVDARGLTVEPAMAPSIQSSGGTTIYSIEGVTEAAVSQRSPVVYVTDPANPLAVTRAGEQPLFVRAAGVEEQVNLVIREEDAVRVRTEAEAAPFLLHANVVIVVDR